MPSPPVIKSGSLRPAMKAKEPAVQRLPFRLRVAYGLGELGPAMAGSTLIFFQLVFLTDVAGLSPGWAGAVLLLARVWDAVNDPLIGWLSDQTRSSWGRRLPWMTAAAVPFALFFAAFWWVPGGLIIPGDQWARFVYYSVVALLYSTAATALGLPHSALTAELSRDYDERSRLTAARMAFSLGGSVGGLLLALVVFRLLPAAPPTVQYGVLGLCIAVLALVAMALCLRGIWGAARRSQAAPVEKKKTAGRWQEWLSLTKNRPFLLVCGIYLCSWLAMQFTAAVLPFYTRNVAGLSTTTFHLLALSVQVTALLLLPVWEHLSFRLGKKAVYFLGMSFWILAQTGLLFLPGGQPAVLFGLGILAGFGISVCYLIPNAMLPDVIEWDELRTGRRREGMYYGVCVFLQKLALALGAFGIGQLLAWNGYLSSAPGEEAPIQPESAIQAIRWAIGPLPALALVAGLVLAWFYPITRQRHARLVGLLALRNQKKGSVASS